MLLNELDNLLLNNKNAAKLKINLNLKINLTRIFPRLRIS